MQIAAGISMVLFIGVCSTVGIRLLFLARRTRGIEELLCACGFTFIGLLGYPASIASGHSVGSIGEMNLAAYAWGTVWNNLGILSFFAFTWRVFRPGEGWALGITLLGASILGAGCVGNLVAVFGAPPEASSYAITHGPTTLLQIASILCFAWTTWEAALQYAASRRRLAIGLGDRATSNRFLLWAVFGASTLILSGVFALLHQLGIPTVTSPFMHVTSAIMGAISSLSIWLAFLPPKFWRARFA
jgi:hypothetical protein